ncbi:MAG: BolA family transcriptional regulator [Gammaproteobacteria bacterium]|nr:BolA family transcriptional regulator [Gammaproteobacteria bacterium]
MNEILNPVRVARMRELLETALTPSALSIIDDSHHHVGHAGAAGGAGHYTVRIVAEAFRGKRPLACHQLVYAALAELMGPEIHALSIQAKAPD